jgi:Antitoxin Xre/MbcA/ParS C-terminal toxin-binding domain
MAPQKKNALVRRVKGSVKGRRKGAIRKSPRIGNLVGELNQARIELSDTIRKLERVRETPLPKQITSETVRAHALEAFGDAEKTDHWLRRPNQLFQGRSPLQVLEVDPAAVEVEIVRIEHGVYV